MWAFWFFPSSICVYYIYLYCRFENGLEKAKEIKLLLGKEQEREFVIGDRLWDETEIAMNKRETPPLLKEFFDFINQEKVEVRAFKNKQTCGFMISRTLRDSLPIADVRPGGRGSSQGTAQLRLLLL